MKPTIPDLQQRISTTLLAKYPEVHHVQLYRNEHQALVLWLTVPWPVPEYLWGELARLTRDVEILLPIVAVQINEMRPSPYLQCSGLSRTPGWISPAPRSWQTVKPSEPC